ncbi:hypothetical protein Tco_0996689 [Tanacetum coccineum]
MEILPVSTSNSTAVASDDLRDALSVIFGLSELKEISSDEETNYDNESFDDDSDDDDVEKDKEEEEHLAPVDPPTVPTDDPIPSS